MAGKQVDPYEYATDPDGILVKNKMPDGDRYLTRKQWLEQGRKVRNGEGPTILHPSRYNSRTCEYYLIEQTEVIDDEAEMCGNCAYRGSDSRMGPRYCPIAGMHVSPDYRCGEWEL